MNDDIDGVAARLERTTAAVDEFRYQCLKLVLLRVQLVSARVGTLESNWRATLVESIEIGGVESDDEVDAADPILVRAASALTTMPPADWEPDRGVGWRTALDSWFAAIKNCLGDLDRLDARLRDEVDVPLGATLTSTIELDLMTASYRAGLAAGGLDVDWFDWLIERVHCWPDKKLRDSQLDLMTMDPDYRAATARLPDYWR